MTKEKPVDGTFEHADLSLNGAGLNSEVVVKPSPKAGAGQDDPARCPHCGREWAEAEDGNLVLQGARVMPGVRCDPDPSPRAMIKMIICGALGAVTGGTILGWLHTQSWFWHLLDRLA